MPPPEPTHWLTVAAVGLGVTPAKLLVTEALQRTVLPPPLPEELHWVTAVTGCARVVVVLVQLAVGAPAAPWHSLIVTVAVPVVAVI